MRHTCLRLLMDIKDRSLRPRSGHSKFLITIPHHIMLTNTGANISVTDIPDNFIREAICILKADVSARTGE